MKLQISSLLTLSLLLTAAAAVGAEPKGAPKNCVSVSGTISGTVTSAAGAAETVVQGTVSGSLQGSVQATVTSLKPQPDGTLKLELKHNFVTDEGFLIATEDSAKLIPVAGLPNVFQQTTEYKIIRGTGRYEGAKGTLTNHGEADLKRGLLTLRYDGKICGVAP